MYDDDGHGGGIGGKEGREVNWGFLAGDGIGDWDGELETTWFLGTPTNW